MPKTCETVTYVGVDDVGTKCDREATAIFTAPSGNRYPVCDLHFVVLTREQEADAEQSS